MKLNTQETLLYLLRKEYNEEYDRHCENPYASRFISFDDWLKEKNLLDESDDK